MKKWIEQYRLKDRYSFLFFLYAAISFPLICQEEIRRFFKNGCAVSRGFEYCGSNAVGVLALFVIIETSMIYEALKGIEKKTELLNLKKIFFFKYRGKFENFPLLGIGFCFIGLFFPFRYGVLVDSVGFFLFLLFFYLSRREYDKYDLIRHDGALSGDTSLPFIVEFVTVGRQYNYIYGKITINDDVYDVVDRYRKWDLVSDVKAGDIIYLKFFKDNPSVFVLTLKE